MTGIIIKDNNITLKLTRLRHKPIKDLERKLILNKDIGKRQLYLSRAGIKKWVIYNRAAYISVQVMDRVDADKARELEVPAYNLIAKAAERTADQIEYLERFQFYETAKNAFAVVQTNDYSLYANCIITKGVIPK